MKLFFLVICPFSALHVCFSIVCVCVCGGGVGRGQAGSSGEFCQILTLLLIERKYKAFPSLCLV